MRWLPNYHALSGKFVAELDLAIKKGILVENASLLNNA